MTDVTVVQERPELDACRCFGQAEAQSAILQANPYKDGIVHQSHPDRWGILSGFPLHPDRPGALEGSGFRIVGGITAEAVTVLAVLLTAVACHSVVGMIGPLALSVLMVQTLYRETRGGGGENNRFGMTAPPNGGLRKKGRVDSRKSESREAGSLESSSAEFRSDAKDEDSGQRFGSRTVLLVEDDSDVREISAEMLREFGFRVLEAKTGDEAVAICRGHTGAIDLLLSDVVMPGMNGPETASAATELHPEMGVLFMSGYSHDSIVRYGLPGRSTNFLQKPFTIRLLHEKIEEVLLSDTSN